LSHPVISVGNIAVGGRAKTPLAAYIATRLRELGERPSILSRGYGRRDAVDGVVVVRDPGGIRADLDRAGDEPLMLARQLDGVAVLVCPDRHLAGRLAEHHFGCTVHVLDDGFQHFPLARDADIVIVAREDVETGRTLPSGRLREPLDALDAADAFIALDDRLGLPAGAGSQGTGRPVWRASRRQQPVRGLDPSVPFPAAFSGPVVAVAGIAQPDGFFAGLRAAGWTIARDLRFRDHHRYSRADLYAIADAARQCGAGAVVTTEKDLVRLLPFRPFPFLLGFAPLSLEIDAADTFDRWLQSRLHAARQPS
jgi:tetraacyldisaccharide 4'-kinase